MPFMVKLQHEYRRARDPKSLAGQQHSRFLHPVRASVHEKLTRLLSYPLCSGSSTKYRSGSLVLGRVAHSLPSICLIFCAAFCPTSSSPRPLEQPGLSSLANRNSSAIFSLPYLILGRDTCPSFQLFRQRGQPTAEELEQRREIITLKSLRRSGWWTFPPA